jgi:DNA replication protein DnaC
MNKHTSYQDLRTHLAYLKLTAIAEQLPAALEQAEKEKPGYTQFLHDLLGVEVDATEQRRLAGRMRFAGFPSTRTLEEFDFTAQPGIDRALINELATLRFVEEKANLLLIGPPGVGKTMLAIALGLKAVQAGYRVHYTTAADLVARTSRAARPSPLGEHDAILGRTAGPDRRRARVSPDGRRGRIAPLPGHSRRYLHGTVILTTNRGTAEWGTIFEDTTVAVATLDRLLHHATVLQIDGDSYRMRGHRAKLAQLRAGLGTHDREPQR